MSPPQIDDAGSVLAGGRAASREPERLLTVSA